MKSRSEFEVNGKRDIDAALAESPDSSENKMEEQEKQIIQKSNDQFNEEQIVQLTIKESMKELPPLQASPVPEEEEDEEEMLRKALQLS